MLGGSMKSGTSVHPHEVPSEAVPHPGGFVPSTPESAELPETELVLTGPARSLAAPGRPLLQPGAATVATIAARPTPAMNLAVRIDSP